MTRTLPSALLALAPLALSSVVGCDAGAAEGEGEGPSPDNDRGVTLAIENGNPPLAPDVQKIAALPDGGAVVATLDFTNGIVVVGLDDAFAVRWTTTFSASGGVTDVVVDGDTIYVVVGQSGSPLRIARLTFDGALTDVHEFADIARGARLLKDEGNFVILATSEVAVFDADFQPLWAKNIAAEAAIVDGGDYLFAGAPLRGAPAQATGAELVRTSKAGEVRYQSFITPGPSQHGVAGLGVIGDEVVVGVGTNGADSRNAASLAPVFVARFDKDTGAPRGMQRLDVDVIVADGRTVPLQFGGGLRAFARGDTFFIGAVANSGALGDDVRTSSIFALSGNSVTAKNVGGAFTVLADGALAGVNSVFGGLRVVRVAAIDAGETCGPIFAGRVTAIDGPVVAAQDVNDIVHVAAVVVASAAAAAPTSTSTEECAAGG